MRVPCVHGGGEVAGQFLAGASSRPLSESPSTRGGGSTQAGPELAASHVAQPESQGPVPRGRAREEGLGQEDARAGRSAPARGVGRPGGGVAA